MSRADYLSDAEVESQRSRREVGSTSPSREGTFAATPLMEPSHSSAASFSQSRVGEMAKLFRGLYDQFEPEPGPRFSKRTALALLAHSLRRFNRPGRWWI